VTTSTFVDTNGPFQGFGFDPSINNLGMIAFDALLRMGNGGSSPGFFSAWKA